MIHPNKALELILNLNINTLSETIPVIHSQGRILAEDIYSNIEIPPFDKSTMDGYAYNSTDTSKIFKVIETIPAGYIPKKAIKPGECSRIMTGGMLPKGCDRVIRFEFTETIENTVRFLKEDTINVQNKASCLTQGEKVLSKNTLIKTNEIAILSSIGYDRVKVNKQPFVGILTTGSELIEPGNKLIDGHIYNSNGPELYSHVLNINNNCKLYDTIPDDKDKIKNQLIKILSECDIIITSGGVSVGDFDFLPKILKELDFDIKFDKLLLKPGKPTLLAIKDTKFVLSLPGNPLSTYVTFELFAKPLIYKFMSYIYKPNIYQGTLTERLSKSSIKRVEYIPVYFDGKEIFPLKYLGSGHINILNQANALVEMDTENKELEKGSLINVRQL